MCHRLLQDSRLWLFLLHIDTDLAREVREGNCPYCGETLHSAPYPRKPRGGPDDLPLEYRSRYSFTCSADGCRRRSTPPSVRFLGRRIYLGVLVILLSAMRQGATPRGARKLTLLFGATKKTLDRWRSWWREIFPRTPFWRSARARFLPPLDETSLPRALLRAFGATSALDKLLALLKFLSPITTRSGLPLHPS